MPQSLLEIRSTDWLVIGPPPRNARVRRFAVVPAEIEQTRARLAIVHGYGDHAGRFLEVMTWLAGRGVACHAFDLRGHGQSSGRRGYVGRWDEYLEDLQAFLRQPDVVRDEKLPLFVLGHSHGGLIVAVAGIRHLLEPLGIAGCILSAPYFINAFKIPRYKTFAARVANVVCPSMRIRSDVGPELLSRDPEIVEASRRDPLLLKCATPRWYLGHRVAQVEALSKVREFTLPLLVIQGDADRIADRRGAKAFHADAGSTDKSLIVYPDFRHEPLREVGRERVFADVLKWIDDRVVNSK